MEARITTTAPRRPDTRRAAPGQAAQHPRDRREARRRRLPGTLGVYHSSGPTLLRLSAPPVALITAAMPR